jgi:cytochrome c oxidase subunit III
MKIESPRQQGRHPFTKFQKTMTEVAAHADGHGHDHHDHPSWLAHHFDDAEQQYDSGKLGMWLFLVTEVLFFSGMFCAYVLYRNRNPEVFEFCSSFLNEKLGAINTGVLLFSSLTMAWAVRASQLQQTKILVGMLGATLGCAAMFLGVKSVEYSHKWSIGLLPGRFYVAQLENAPHPETNYLQMLCVIPAILTAAFLLYYVYSLVIASKFHQRVSGPLLVSGLCFFAGVGLGNVLESGEHHDDHAAGSHAHDDAHGHDHADHAAEGAGTAEKATEKTAEEGISFVKTSGGPVNDVLVTKEEEGIPNSKVNNQGMAGLFFSIYYCMTGVHAVHIIGGMVVITWLIVKASREEFHSQYFGPVDNVGLYWHLVDFIWIYLFPLLYLIT